MDNVVVFEHPLIQHKISLLRDKNTGTNEFRQLVDEIAMLEGFEALSDLPVEDVEIETPIEKCMTPMIAGRTCRCSDPSCRSWHGIRHSGIGAICESRSYWNVS